MLNTQVQKELESAYLYLDFAVYFEEDGLPGFAHWFRVQAAEERIHALKFIDYLHEIKSPVKLMNINAHKQEYKCERELLEEALKHEQYITGLINEIYTEAMSAGDYRTMNFLNWFISEQREEERNAQELIDKYRLYAEDGAGLYKLDEELSERRD